MEDQIQVNVTKDEAIVLFEFLARFNERKEVTIQHESERIVLWNLLAQLEQKLNEPLDPHYQRILDSSRKRLSPPSIGSK